MIIKELSLWLGERHGTEVVYVSQYDNMWRFKVSLIYNSQIWTIPSGATLLLNGRKPDGNVVSITGTKNQDNTITFNSSTQLTAVAGKTICEVSVIQNGNYLGSSNFILLVEESPMGPDDVVSQSVLSTFGEYIDRLSSANTES